MQLLALNDMEPSSPTISSFSFPGLVAFNVLGFISTLTAVVTWLVQFFVKLRINVLIREDVSNGGWTSEGRATVGYSFWLVFAASGLFFLNSAVVLLLQRSRSRRRKAKSHIVSAASKPNGNLMLY